jgi:hypothetical protein
MKPDTIRICNWLNWQKLSFGIFVNLSEGHFFHKKLGMKILNFFAPNKSDRKYLLKSQIAGVSINRFSFYSHLKN